MRRNAGDRHLPRGWHVFAGGCPVSARAVGRQAVGRPGWLSGGTRPPADVPYRPWRTTRSMSRPPSGPAAGDSTGAEAWLRHLAERYAADPAVEAITITGSHAGDYATAPSDVD